MSGFSDWITGPAGLPAQLAHRLTQPRRKRKVASVDWRDVVSYEELLSRRSPSLIRLHESAPPLPNTSLLFPDLATPEILESHFLRAEEAPAIGLACLRDVVVSGQSLVGRSWLLYQLGPLAPRYVDDYLRQNLHVGDRKITRKQKIVVSTPTALVTHWNSGVYGHWLLEGMPKLLLLRELRDRLPALRIALPRSLPAWTSTWITKLLPDAAIELYDDRTSYLHCRTLLAPTLITDPVHHLFHPHFAQLLASIEPPLTSSVRRARLYVSRSSPSIYRRLSNEAEIEDIAATEGLEVVKPDTLFIDEQIALFARAEIIVGEFGSAMHNTLFSPPDARVLCLNWINGLQSRIAQLKQHRVGYLLPSNGVPVKFVDGVPLQTYHIDPRQFRACIRTLLAG